MTDRAVEFDVDGFYSTVTGAVPANTFLPGKAGGLLGIEVDGEWVRS